MDDTAYCLSYSKLGFILAAAAMNILVFLALCIMTRRNCVKDGCLTWDVCTESWVQTHRKWFIHVPPVTIYKRNLFRQINEGNEWRKDIYFHSKHNISTCEWRCLVDKKVITSPVRDTTHSWVDECIHRRKNLCCDSINSSSQLPHIALSHRQSYCG